MKIVFYLGAIVASFLWHLLADLLLLAVAIGLLLLLAHADVGGVAPLGVLDVGKPALGFDLLLFVDVDADLDLLGPDLGLAVGRGDGQALLGLDGGLQGSLLFFARGLKGGNADLGFLLFEFNSAITL